MAKEDLRQLIEQGPGAVEETTGFIGLPKGFQGPAPARYRTGDELRPSSLSVEEVARLQESLDMAGLYDPEAEPRRGTWLEEDVKAYKRLLSFANQAGLDAGNALIRIGTSQTAGRGRAKRGRAAQIDITSSEDLRFLADRVAKKSIGKSLDDNQLNNFIKAYQSLETSGAAGIPSPEAFVTSKVEQANPQETFAHKYVEKFDVFDQLMGGSLG